MMKAVVNQLKYMMIRCMRSVGCFMMSRKLPLAELVLGLVSTIWSGSTGIPFFLLASDNTFCASSILDLERRDKVLGGGWARYHHFTAIPGYQPPGRLRQPEENDGADTDHGGYRDEVEGIITESIGQG